MTVIDADAHVIENERTWSYMTGKDERYRPIFVEQTGGDLLRNDRGSVTKAWWRMDGTMHQADSNVDYKAMDPESREMTSVQKRVDHMDELGIDAQVLYPSLFLTPVSRNVEAEYALFHAYNLWLADIWKQQPKRLRWAAMVSLQDMSRVREELEFCKENGAVSVFMRPFECERHIDDNYFFPFYEAAQELDLAITFHTGNASFAMNEFTDGHNFAKFKLAMIASFHKLMESELPKRFPDLRWGFIEACAAWVPYALLDLEKRFTRRGKRVGADPLGDNNIFVTIEMTDDIPYIINRVGDDNLVVGTDYGHTDTSAQIEAFRLLRENGEVAAASVDKILGPNSQKLYGLN